MSAVAIIDTGIDLKSGFLSFKKIDGISIDKNKDTDEIIIENYLNNPDCIQDTIGHGTAVAGIIFEHNPEVEIYIIKLFHGDAMEADEDLLCCALEYLLDNVKCDIINLSLGICVSESDRLRDLCMKLYNRKKYIVSAFDNNGAISFPAAYKGVVGVTNSNICYRNNDMYVVNNEIVNVCAKGRFQRIIWLNNTLLVGAGNSYACAHVSGILSQDIKKENINKIIKSKAIGTIEIEDNHAVVTNNPIENYKKMVIFPFNKEMHSFVRFKEMLCCELVGVYDLKFSANVGAFTNDLLGLKNEINYKIHNITDIDWDSFDTFVLGHCDELFGIIDDPQYKQKLIDNILLHDKYLYSFDDLSGYKIDKRFIHRVFYPKVSKHDVPISPFGKLYRQGKPVLGIFGTSSRQGKFTLQLHIRSELIRRGYNIAQIGTEPSSLLYGMDAVFPVGYNSSVHINRKDTVSYLNYIMHQVSSSADMIIVGGQSGVVIRDDGNLDNYNFNQVDFLYATQPDAVILCVNFEDDNEVISRTISFIESATGSKVIALVVFPLHQRIQNSGYKQLVKLTKYEFACYKEQLSYKHKLPVYNLDSLFDIKALTDSIIEFF